MKNQFGVERKPILNNAISQFLVSSNFFTKRNKKIIQFVLYEIFRIQNLPTFSPSEK